MPDQRIEIAIQEIGNKIHQTLSDEKQPLNSELGSSLLMAAHCALWDAARVAGGFTLIKNYVASKLKGTKHRANKLTLQSAVLQTLLNDFAIISGDSTYRFLKKNRNYVGGNGTYRPDLDGIYKQETIYDENEVFQGYHFEFFSDSLADFFQLCENMSSEEKLDLMLLMGKDELL